MLLAHPDIGEMSWNGKEALVKKNQYIARFTDVSGSRVQQEALVQQKLAAAGIPFVSAQYLGLSGMILLDVAEHVSYKDLRTVLNGVPGFSYIEPNFVRTDTLSAFPNDPAFDQLYGLHNTGQDIPFLGAGVPDADIDAPEAWDITTGDPNVVVAVIDTGVDYTHEDLAANMWTNPGELPNNDEDDDGNGFVDDYYGYDFINNDSDPFDDHSHGTHTSGTIGAVGDNGIGVVGVNWNVKIMAVKWIDAFGGGTDAAAIAAINYVTQMRLAGTNVKLSSNSWHLGPFADSQALKDSIIAHGDAGLLFVIAAGNDAVDRDTFADYPASYNLPNMLTVAATDNSDNRAGFSAWGLNTVHLGAPGVSTLSTTPGNTYSFFDGTSMATPHVAGAAALAWSIAPNATYQDIRAAILAGVDPIDALRTDGPTPVASGGRLNAYNTLLQLGLTVIGTSPANGEIIATTPSDFIVNFSDVLDPSTVDASDLLVNGIPAQSVVLSNGDQTATFSYLSSPVTVQGLQTLFLAQDSMARISDGDGLQEYSATFRYDVLAMQVVSTDPADGSSTQLPLTSLIVNLNEPYAQSSVSTDDVSLNIGSVVGFNFVDADTVEYLLAGINQEGTLTFSLAFGALTDEFGNPSQPFSGSTSLDFGIVPFPVPTLLVEPRGALIYQTSITGIIQPADDTDGFIITIDSGQQITVVVTPLDDSLRPEVTLARLSGGGNPVVIGTGAAGAPGEDAVIQSVQTQGNIWQTNPPPREYLVTVAGTDGTTGAFRVTLILNAAVEDEDHGGSSNDSLESAQSLEGAFLSVATNATPTPARAGALGAVRGGALPGEAIIAVRDFDNVGGSLIRVDQAGNVVQTILSPELERGFISDVELGPDNVIYVGLCTDDFSGSTVSGEILKFDFSGEFLGSVVLPDDPANSFFFYPFLFEVAADGTMWVPQVNAGNLIHVAADGSELDSVSISGNQRDVTVGADGLVYVTTFDFSTGVCVIVQVDPGTGTVSSFVPFTGFDSYGINATADGKFWVSDFNGGASRYDSTGAADRLVPWFAAVDAQQDPGDGLWISAFFNGIAKFDSANNFQFAFPAPNGNALGLAVLGVDSPDPLPAVDLADYYSFQLTAGRSATITVERLSGGPVTVELLDSAGNVIALSAASGGIDAVIDDFVASATGTFYVRITGNGSEYSLAVMRNLGFDIGNNDSFATAQDVIAPVVAGQRNILGQLGGIEGQGDVSGVDGPAYVRSDLGPPWFVSTNEIAMDRVFGAGSWADLRFETVDPVELFSDDHEFVFLEGSDFNADALEAFLTANLPLIEDYVAAGNTLFLNAAPNVGDGMSFGFGDVTLVYFDGSPDAHAADDAHPIFAGPFTPVTTSYTGNFFSHASVNGGGLDPVLLSSTDQIVLAEMQWGLGLVLFGGMTTTNWHAPQPQADNLRANIINYTAAPGHVDVGDLYRVQARPTTSFSISTLTPAGGSGEFVNTLDPIIRLYDGAGNLLATNDNGAADGRNALLKYKVPAGGSIQNYYIEVASVGDTKGEYVLQIGGPFYSPDPFQVAAIDPTDGERVRGPQTAVTVDFNDLVLLSSLQAGDLTVDGVPASDVTIVDGDTAIFDISGITLGEGTHTIAIAGGAIVDLQNTPIAAFSSSFYNDITAPRVTDSSIQEGDVLSTTGSLVYDVIFSEPMDTNVIDIFDVGLFGNLRGSSYTPTSLTFDATGTIATITFDGVLDDFYTLYLFSYPGGFQDEIGFILDGEPLTWNIPPNESGDGVEGGDFFVNFGIDLGTQALPVPLVPVDPLGSVIYQSPFAAIGTAVFVGDADDFTIDLDAGQTVTVLFASASTDLQLSVFDPSDVQLGSTVTAPAGGEGVFQATAITGAGTYRLNLESLSGTGLYSIFLIVNAAVEDEAHGGPPNDELATAQALDATFISLADGVTRGAVLGQVSSNIVDVVYLADFESGDQGFTVDNTHPDPFYLPGLWHLSTGRGAQPGHSATTSFYYGAGEGPDGGGSINIGVTQPSPNPTFGTITSPPIVLPATGNLAVDFNYVLQTRFFPDFVDFARLHINDGSGWTFLAGFDRVAESSEWRASDPVDISAYAGQTIQLQWSFDTVLGPVGRFPEGWYVDDVRVVELSLDDYYSFTLEAGESASIALTSLTGGNVEVTLVAPDGTPLALGAAGATNVDKLINGFVAPETGTYYTRVTGDLGTNYSVVVTRNAAFESEPNDDFDSAQQLSPSQGALGHVGGASTLYVGTRNGELFTVDLSTGAGTFVGFLPIAATEIEYDNLTGRAFAQAPDGAFFGMEFDITTGAGIGDAIFNGASFTGLEWVGSTLYGTAITGGGGASTLRTLDPFTGVSVVIGDTGFGPISGLAYDESAGVMYGITGGFGGSQLLTIDLATGVATSIGETGFQAGSLEFGPDGNLYGSGTGVSSGALFRVDPETGAGTLVGFTGFFNLTGLTLVAGAPPEDWYSLSVEEGDDLVIETRTPADGAGEFVNLLDPHIELYDPSGTLVASGVALGDGRNEQIAVSALVSGQYRVRVIAEGDAAGEYALSVQGATGDLPPFSVVATDPAADARVRGPQQSITVDFGDIVALASLEASDLTVDGVPAGGFSLVDGDTVAFDISGLGLSEGPHTIAIADGAILDIQGTLITAFSSSFYNDITAPRVIDSSIQEGDVLDSSGSLVYQVIFSEPMDSTVIDIFDVGLFGGLRGTFANPSSISFDAAGTIATIAFDGLLDDFYTLYLFSFPGGFQDEVGFILDGEPLTWDIPPNESGDGFEGGDFFVNFSIDLGTQALPVPLVPVNPLGSLIYQSPFTSTGTAVFAGDTDDFTIDLDAGQTISVLVGALSAAVQPTVDVFDAADVPLGPTAVAPAAGGEAVFQATALTGPGTYRILVGSAGGLGLYSVQIVVNAALEEETHGGPPNGDLATAQALDAAFITLAEGVTRGAVLGQVSSNIVDVVYLADFESGDQGFTVDNTHPDPFYLPGLWHLSTGRGAQPGHSATTSFYYGAGEGPDGGGSINIGVTQPSPNPTFGTITSPPIVLPATGNLAVDFNYVLQTRFFPDFVDFARLHINDGSGWTFLAGFDRVAESSEWRASDPVDISAYAGQTIQLQWSFDTVLGPVGRFPEGWYVDDVRVAQVSLDDYYSFTLEAGESATIALTALSGGNVDLALFAPDGTLLALGTSGAANVDELIDGFVAPESGTYYARVTGDLGTRYSLLVTRGAAFDTEVNNDMATAQPLSIPEVNGARWALGAITAGGTIEDFDDGDISDYTSIGVGAIVSAAAAHDGPFGLETSSFQTDWVYRDDADVQVAPGDVISVWVQASGFLGGRAYFGFGASAAGTYSLVMAPNTGELIIQRNIGLFDFFNLAAVPQAWSLDQWYRFEVEWGDGGNITGRLFDSDGTTLLNTVSAVDTTFTSGGIAFRGFDGAKYFDTVEVGGGEVDADWYHITAEGGAILEIATSTPSDGPGEFANLLDPVINLYDAAGNLVATNDNGAADGRNAVLTYVVPLDAGGVYYIEIMASGATPEPTKGEYLLSVQGAAETLESLSRADINLVGIAGNHLSIAVVAASAITTVDDGGELGDTGASLRSSGVRIAQPSGASSLAGVSRPARSRFPVAGDNRVSIDTIDLAIEGLSNNEGELDGDYYDIGVLLPGRRRGRRL
jgi:subtilisin family serine protease